MDTQWLAEELERSLGSRRSAAIGSVCAVAWHPLDHCVTVAGPAWQLRLRLVDDRLTSAYDGDFDLDAARARVIADQLTAVLANLTSIERRHLWAVRQRRREQHSPRH